MSDSLSRRAMFARDSFLVFDRLFCSGPLAPLARLRDFEAPRIPDHAARLAFDLVECVRTRGVVPELGNVELAIVDGGARVPQHPRYLCYWQDEALHAGVGMIVGADVIRHEGRYYVIELNQGPSLYARRRELYATSAFDPLIETLVTTARDLGYRRLVPVAFAWKAAYVEELRRAGDAFGVEVTPMTSPLSQPGGAPRMLALPRPLPRDTMYAIHSGPAGPVFSLIDNKWCVSKWLTTAAQPRTSEELFVPPPRGERWPNLVVKLAGSARSRHVLAGRFESEAEARAAFGDGIPRQLRAGYLLNLLLHGRDQVLFQEFIPPELDDRGRARMIRLHLFVSPMRTMFLSAHFRISRRAVPERAPRGVIRQDDAFVFNDADYALLTPEVEAEVRDLAEDLGRAIQTAVEARFEFGVR